MKVFELRGFLKERGVKGYSTMKKSELEAKVQKLEEQERVETYEQNLRDTALCSACLHEQRAQRRIDKKTHDRRLLERAVRTLVCEHCRHVEITVDGDQTACVGCGTLQDPEVVAAVRYR